MKNYSITKINPADVQQVVTTNQSGGEGGGENSRRKNTINKVNCFHFPPVFAEGSAAVIVLMTLLIEVDFYKSALNRVISAVFAYLCTGV